MAADSGPAYAGYGTHTPELEGMLGGAVGDGTPGQIQGASRLGVTSSGRDASLMLLPCSFWFRLGGFWTAFTPSGYPDEPPLLEGVSRVICIFPADQAE